MTPHLVSPLKMIQYSIERLYPVLHNAQPLCCFAPPTKQLIVNFLAHTCMKSIIIVYLLQQMQQHSLQPYTIRGWRTIFQSLLCSKQNSKHLTSANASTKADYLLPTPNGIRTKISLKIKTSCNAPHIVPHTSTSSMRTYSVVSVKLKTIWK